MGRRASHVWRPDTGDDQNATGISDRRRRDGPLKLRDEAALQRNARVESERLIGRSSVCACVADIALLRRRAGSRAVVPRTLDYLARRRERNPGAAAQIEDSPVDVLRVCTPVRLPPHLNEGEVARLSPISKYGHGLSCDRRAAEDVERHVWSLPGAVDREEAKDHGLDSVVGTIERAQVLGGQLRSAIRRERLGVAASGVGSDSACPYIEDEDA